VVWRDGWVGAGGAAVAGVAGSSARVAWVGAGGFAGCGVGVVEWMRWIDGGDLPEFGDFRHYGWDVYGYGDWDQWQFDGYCSGDAYGQLGYSPTPPLPYFLT
jgi:hypothetical protein